MNSSSLTWVGVLLPFSSEFTKSHIMKTYIYFIRAGNYGSPIKIGVANNIAKRMAELQTGNPYKLVLVDWIEFDSRRKAYDIERKIHKELSQKRMEGEWFKGNTHWKSCYYYKKSMPTDETYPDAVIDDIYMAYNASQYI